MLEQEGKGVRLPISGMSDTDSHMTGVKPKLNQKLELVEEKSFDAFTACSEYEKKLKKKEAQREIIYPTANDMKDQNDFMFFQVFGALTDKYIEEEVDDEQARHSQ